MRKSVYFVSTVATLCLVYALLPFFSDTGFGIANQIVNGDRTYNQVALADEFNTPENNSYASYAALSQDKTLFSISTGSSDEMSPNDFRKLLAYSKSDSSSDVLALVNTSTSVL